MGEAFIVRRGGGSSSEGFAAISVTYPAGSMCTCSNGQKTLKAKDTSGSWLFVVPVSGEWTVTLTQGDRTVSQMVSISEYGQVEQITLSYTLWLFKDGDPCTVDTGGWGSRSAGYTVNGGIQTAVNDDSCKVESDRLVMKGVANQYWGIGGTYNKINLTLYNTLYFSISTITSTDVIMMGAINQRDLFSGNGATSHFNAWISPRTSGIFSVDISGLNGEFYIAVVTNREIRFDKIWLE